MDLTRSQRILLEAIDRRDGLWNDYQLGRYCLSRLDSPADFTLRPLFEAGYLESRPTAGEPLPRLYITEQGRQALQSLAPEATSR